MNVLVTGAGRGLGLEMARQAAAAGHAVWGTVRRSGADALAEVGASALTLDVSRPETFAAFADSVPVDRIDLLVHNAGINSRGVPEGQGNVRFGQLEPRGLEAMNRVNAIGPLLLTQALAGRLGEGSTVVAVSSWLGSIGGKSSGGNYGYCASKTLLNMYLRAMAFDLKPSGVTTILVNPGWVQTDMGGSRAKFTPEESVAGILALAARVTPDDAGAFFDHDGTPHAW